MACGWDTLFLPMLIIGVALVVTGIVLLIKPCLLSVALPRRLALATITGDAQMPMGIGAGVVFRPAEREG